MDSYVPKVGDELIMAYQGSTVRNKTGVVTSVSDDMAQVDFGGGDSYGILFSRIKGEPYSLNIVNDIDIVLFLVDCLFSLNSKLSDLFGFVSK